MKKKIVSFGDFRTLAEDIFSAFKENSNMHDLRVWKEYPGDTLKERKCWYIAVRLSDEVQMMITYDSLDDDPNPYVCWYDYSTGTVTYPHWCFDNLEDAMLFCCKEPHHNYRSHHRDLYCLFRFAGKRRLWQVISGLSVLSIPDYVKNEPHIPSGEWEVRRFSDISMQIGGEVIYKLNIQNDCQSDYPMSAIAEWGIPEYIYENGK